MTDENLKTDLITARDESALPDEIGKQELTALTMIHEMKTVGQIADQLDVTEPTVYRLINGLCGKKQDVPKKYRCENAYVERLPDTVDLPLKFQLTPLGKQVVAEHDTPSNSDNGSGDSVVSESGESAEGDWMVRPHNMVAKFMIREKPSGWGSPQFFIDRDLDWSETVQKELPDGSVIEGRAVYYEGRRIELYRDSVVVEWRYSGERRGAKQFWSGFWRKMREVQQYLHREFGVRLRSSPENVEGSMVPEREGEGGVRKQEWAHLDDVFAEMVVEHSDEWNDENPGVLWQVRNERDEPVAVVDTSPASMEGEDAEVELEWIHPREAKNHMDNVKDLLLWGSYYEITPADFKSLRWLREHVGMFEEIADRVGEISELEERMGRVEDEVEVVRRDVRAVSESVEEGFDAAHERIDMNTKSVMGVADAVGAVQDDVGALADHVSVMQSRQREIAEILDAERQGVSQLVSVVERQQHVIHQQAALIEAVRQDMDERTALLRENIEAVDEKTVSYQVAALIESVRERVSGVVDRVRGWLR